MKHTEKYLHAKWVTENPKGHDERYVIDAKRYCNAYLEGYNQALNLGGVSVSFTDRLFEIAYDYESSVSERMEQIKTLLVNKH